jgi:flagellar biosynthesis protein FlhA
MNPWMQRLDGLLGANAGLIRNLAPPIFIVIVLAMMVLPIPALAAGRVLHLQHRVALMVMMVAAYMVRRWTSRPSRRCCC